MMPGDFASPTPAAMERPLGDNLEVRLLPLVRRALRTRIGLPALVGWVQRSAATLDNGLPSDFDRTAQGLTRLLCDVLQRQPSFPGNHATDTVFGP
jgi:hypothetical protein